MQLPEHTSKLDLPEELQPYFMKSLEILGYPDIREGQVPLMKEIFTGNNVIALLPTGGGKCLGHGTPILMYNGDVIPVQDIKVGDRVMGPDSKPRKVLDTCTGKEELYKVTPVKGDPYVVNASHILSLKQTGLKSNPKYPSQRGKGKIVNVAVKDYVDKSKHFKHTHKGWRTGVDFELSELLPLELEPYFLGLWLGDGSAASCAITTIDDEIRDYIADLVCRFNWKLRTEHKSDSDVKTYYISNNYQRQGTAWTAMRRLGLHKGKRIPKAYKVASRKARLELLAGLLDSDGHLHHNGYDFVQKRKDLADDVVFLCRSLGLAAYVKECSKSCKVAHGTFTGTYYRVSISGDCSDIPLKLAYKKAKPRKQIKDVQVTGITVEPIGVGDYYGFAVDSDHLFLLGDFTVTHNSASFILPGLSRGYRTVVISPLISLQTDQVSKLTEFNVPAAAINSTNTPAQNQEYLDAWSEGKLQFLYIAPERLATDNGMARILKQPCDMVVVDEAHCVAEWGDSFRPAYKRIPEFVAQLPGTTQVVALSATLTLHAESHLRRILHFDEEVKRVEVVYNRTNISYRTFLGGDIYDLTNVCREEPGPTIVFCTTTGKVDATARQLASRLGCTVLRYHGKLSAAQKRKMQEQFMSGKHNLIVATNAFGMGVDKADIRQVIHYDMPGKLEAFAQEAGRGGRDGLPCRSVLFYDSDILRTHKQFIANGNPSPNSVRKVWNYLQTQSEKGTLEVKVLPETIAKAGGVQMYGSDTVLNLLIGGKLITPPDTVGMEVIQLLKQPPKSQLAWFEAYAKLSEWSKEESIPKGGKITVPTRQLATMLKFNMVSKMRNVLSFMRDRGIIRYTPGTTKYKVNYGTNIDEAIDWDLVLDKRDNDFSSLETMVEFTKAPDRLKADMISNYFSTGKLK